MPHVVAGVKFEQGWGAVSAVGGYDSASEEFAGKLRLDVKFGDAISGFIMGGYQSDPDKPNYYGAWNGDYAFWVACQPKLRIKLLSTARLLTRRKVRSLQR